MSKQLYRPAGYKICLLVVLSLLFLPVRSLQANSAVYVVQPGDTLSGISAKFDVSVSALIAANQLTSNYVIIGEELTIPNEDGSALVITDDATTSDATDAADESRVITGRDTVIVGYGDTLSSIAETYDMSVSELMTLNGMGGSNIRLGQKLKVNLYGSSQSIPVDESVDPLLSNGVPEDTSDISTFTPDNDSVYNIHIVQVGETLSQIAQHYDITVKDLLKANNLVSAHTIDAGEKLRITNQGIPISTIDDQYAPDPGERMIEVDLSAQTLTAWNGDFVVMRTFISSGRGETPTVTGRFEVERKKPEEHMSGADFDIPDVPWVMYFFDGYAFHGAYWHHNFGQPMSHGCVHLTPTEAEQLYNWAAVGTEVFVHW